MKERSASQLFLHPIAFVSLLGQLVILLTVAWYFQIEVERGLVTSIPVILAGFAIHAWLPLRLRIPFFLVLTAVIAVLLMGVVPGALLFGLGLGLLGLCHLPIPVRYRVVPVLAVGAGLAISLARGWGGESGTVVIAVLAALFMFRIVLYLYDLATENTPATPWQRISYFFMFPNIFFPLFPIVDYQRWVDGYYSRDAGDLYQKGMQWILRGLAHMILYRLVYHLIPSVTEVHGPVGVLLLGAFTFGLYLRISGLFHIATGMLHLFGFDLPPTHNRYFLASGFNDLWRRANIYFKDFMMKLVFYPLVNRWRKWGLTRGMGFAALVVGVVSWHVHSYQWFWLQGTYPISATDSIFWLTLGAGIALNTVWEARRPTRRRLGQNQKPFRDALARSIKTVAFFLFLSQMWLLWDSGTLADWRFRVSRVTEGSLLDWMAAFGILLAAVAVGTAWQLVWARSWALPRIRRPGFIRPAVATAATGIAILAIGLPRVHEALGDYPTRAVAKARSTELNRIDEERRIRGYYEALTRSVQFQSPLWDGGVETWREEWEGTEPTRPRHDERYQELIPNFDAEHRGTRMTTNRWGMRDKDYTLSKPPGTIRIAVVGTSIAVGPGVVDGRNFESLIEDELNRSGDQDYEVLNFAVFGAAPHQTALRVREDVPAFEPDVIFYFAHLNDEARIPSVFQSLMQRDSFSISDPVVREVVEASGVSRGMSDEEVAYRIQPFAPRLLRYSYSTITEVAESLGAVPVWIYLPDLKAPETGRTLRYLERTALEAGFKTVLLTGVFEGHDLVDLRIARWDRHLNELGHRLVAEAVLDALRSDPRLLGRSDQEDLQDNVAETSPREGE